MKYYLFIKSDIWKIYCNAIFLNHLRTLTILQQCKKLNRVFFFMSIIYLFKGLKIVFSTF